MFFFLSPSGQIRALSFPDSFLFLPAQRMAARRQLNDSGSDSISLILKLGWKLVCEPNFNNTSMSSLLFTHSRLCVCWGMCVCVLRASIEYKRIDPALRRPPSPSRLTPEINIWLPAQPLTSFVCRLVPVKGKERKGKDSSSVGNPLSKPRP